MKMDPGFRRDDGMDPGFRRDDGMDPRFRGDDGMDLRLRGDDGTQTQPTSYVVPCPILARAEAKA
jgi:hypothetical protein